MRPRAGGLESAWAGGLEEPEQQMRRPRRGPAWAGPGRLAGGRCSAYALLCTVIIPLFFICKIILHYFPMRARKF